jgi:hypothetical protein
MQQEAGLHSASEKFLRGELPKAQAARLEMILNKRRELQGLVANLAASLIQNGCIDENVFDHMGYNLNTSIPAIENNRSLILQILPDLVEFERTGHIMRFRAPVLWLATVLGVAASQGVFQTTDLSSCAMMCNIPNINLGAAVLNQSV